MQEYMLNPDDHYLLGPTIGAASLHMATIDARGANTMKHLTCETALPFPPLPS